MPRKKPFSNKQKKVQLQKSRAKKREKDDATAKVSDQSSDEESQSHDVSQDQSHDTSQDQSHDQTELISVDKVHHQPVKGGRSYNPNRYRLHFERESQEEISKRKMLAKKKIIKPVDPVTMEMGVDDLYRPGSVLDMPKRPAWHYSMSKAEVEGQEEAMFDHYLKDIYSRHKPEELSYFEHNLETWRQLWRVLEISDVVLLITDIRHPALHFPPALYDYVVKELKKQLVLILNKVDLVPPQVAVAWRHYFLKRFPQLNVICFTCYPNKDVSTQSTKKVRIKYRRGRHGKLPSAVGPRELFAVISEMYRGKVDVSEWRDKVTPTSEASAVVSGQGSDHDTSSSDSEDPGEVTMATVSSNPLDDEGVGSAGVLTIGMVGHPNVGKSSIINGLQGRKVVSTSRTPGHTKHFQTIFLTPSLRLCDCPGLVFPSLVSRQLQILSGVYPVAQVREPYTAVAYVAQRLPLVELLSLKHPLTIATVAKKTKGRRTGDFELESPPETSTGHVTSDRSHVIKDDYEWTAWDLCDAWAENRGYYTARGARLDTYRAANSLLRLVVDGRICLFFVPPGYSQEDWEGHAEVGEMIGLQQEGMTAPDPDQSSREEKAFPELTAPMENKFAALLHVEDSD